jgi:actin cytoskeleton-regulatory complex protein END3
MSPTDQRNYERIYSANSNRHGQISFSGLSDFYSTISVPDTDIRRAWNLVNQKQSEFVNKDATLYFLHILNQRHQGVRIPRSIPASLRATLNQGDIEYDLSRTKIGRDRGDDVPVTRPRGRDEWESTTSTRKDDFAAGYLSRLGVGEGNSRYNSAGKQFHTMLT